MISTKYSIWLLLSKEDKTYISDIISSLGIEYNAPIFHPHCTLFSPVTNLETAQTLIDQLNFKPFDVQMRGLGQTDIIWKTVFIKLEASPYLTLLNYLFSQAFDTDYEFLPHFSLIYKEMDSNLKNKIINKLDLKETYRVNGIAIVNTAGQVERWKRVYEDYWTT